MASTIEQGYMASPDPEFKTKAQQAPPLGVKLQLLTIGGVCVYGQWSDYGGYTHWAPLLSVPKRDRYTAILASGVNAPVLDPFSVALGTSPENVISAARLSYGPRLLMVLRRHVQALDYAGDLEVQ